MPYVVYTIIYLHMKIYTGICFFQLCDVSKLVIIHKKINLAIH